MVKAWALMVALALPGLALAAGPDDAFDRASQAYAKGNWNEAAEGFQELLRYGFRDARLEYNLAGAEYKRGRLGQAVLHYERARRLDPGDHDTIANLELVRSKLRDVVPADPSESGIVGAIRRFQDRWGVTAQAAVALAGVWAAAFLLVVGASRSGGFTPGRSWLLAGALLVALAVGASWRATDRRLYGARRAVVLAPSVEALAGPGLENTALFTLHEGTTVVVRTERDGWLQVALPNGLSGWVARDAAERI